MCSQFADSSLRLLTHGPRAWLEIPNPHTGAQQRIIEWNKYDQSKATSYSYARIGPDVLRISHQPGQSYPAAVKITFATRGERDDCVRFLPDGWNAEGQGYKSFEGHAD